MNQIIIYIILVLTGACMGSFIGATVWRLRAKELEQAKADKRPYDKKEYSKLSKLNIKNVFKDRSHCLDCGHELRWYDLVPILSWLSLGGKCRYCKHFIGWQELLVELSLVAFFVLSYLLWPGGVQSGLEITHFILWLIAGVIMAVLFLYDLKWFLLPNGYTIALFATGLAIVATSALETNDFGQTIITAVGSVGVIGGLYAVIYAVSNGRWVGFGDVKLGVGLGLILVDWQLAAVALFMANFIGCLIVIPLMIAKKLKRSSKIPFGPMLIAGSVVAWFFGWSILNWYMSSLGI